MKRSLRVGIQGVLAVGLAISTSCGGRVDEPLGISQQALDDSSWYFWNYHANFPYAFYGNCPANSNSCTNNCDYSNQGQQVYTNGPFNGFDLDWSGGNWVGGAKIRLPVDAQYVDYSNLTVTCTNGGGTGTEWIPRFRQIKSDGTLGQAFLFNHLRHSSTSGNGLITKGTKYNAGTLIGYEGGYACNEGNGIWTNPSTGAKVRISTGDHGCMVTAQPVAPCGFLIHGHVATSSCKYSNGSGANPISACNAAAIPLAPTGLSPSSGTWANPVPLSWSAPSGATSYNVQIQYYDGLSWQVEFYFNGLSSPSYSFNAAHPGAAYAFWAGACNTNGCSPWSNGAQWTAQ